jgi:hypothetical protein
VGEALARLEQQGAIERTPAGWRARAIPDGGSPVGQRAPLAEATPAFPRSPLGGSGSGTRPEAG